MSTKQTNPDTGQPATTPAPVEHEPPKHGGSYTINEDGSLTRNTGPQIDEPAEEQ